MTSTADNTNLNPEWTPLYKMAGISALMLLVIVILQFIVFIIAPQPLDGTAVDWFTLFQNNKLIGLIDFEILMIVYVVISLPISLALYILLKADQSFLDDHLCGSQLHWSDLFHRCQAEPSKCFISATDTLPRKQMQDERCFWQQAKQSWPLSTGLRFM